MSTVRAGQIRARADGADPVLVDAAIGDGFIVHRDGVPIGTGTAESVAKRWPVVVREPGVVVAPAGDGTACVTELPSDAEVRESLDGTQRVVTEAPDGARPDSKVYAWGADGDLWPTYTAEQVLCRWPRVVTTPVEAIVLRVVREVAIGDDYRTPFKLRDAVLHRQVTTVQQARELTQHVLGEERWGWLPEQLRAALMADVAPLCVAQTRVSTDPAMASVGQSRIRVIDHIPDNPITKQWVYVAGESSWFASEASILERWPYVEIEPVGNGDSDREQLGREVRRIWMEWAAKQPDVAEHPSWLVPWEQLAERDREVDRLIGDGIARLMAADRDAARRKLHETRADLGKAVADRLAALRASARDRDEVRRLTAALLAVEEHRDELDRELVEARTAIANLIAFALDPEHIGNARLSPSMQREFLVSMAEKLAQQDIR